MRTSQTSSEERCWFSKAWKCGGVFLLKGACCFFRTRAYSWGDLRTLCVKCSCLFIAALVGSALSLGVYRVSDNGVAHLPRFRWRHGGGEEGAVPNLYAQLWSAEHCPYRRPHLGMVPERSLSCSSESSLDDISIKPVNKIELRSFECWVYKYINTCICRYMCLQNHKFLKNNLHDLKSSPCWPFQFSSFLDLAFQGLCYNRLGSLTKTPVGKLAAREWL